MRDWRGGLLTILAVLATLWGCQEGRAAGNQSPTVQTSTVTDVTMDGIAIAGSTGVYIARRGGAETRIEFAVPADRINTAFYHLAEKLGETGEVVAMLDTYGSGASEGDRCATGRESWLRVFSLTEKRQLGAMLVASCLDRVEAGDWPVVWTGNGFRTTGPTSRAFDVDTRGITPRA